MCREQELVRHEPQKTQDKDPGKEVGTAEARCALRILNLRPLCAACTSATMARMRAMARLTCTSAKMSGNALGRAIFHRYGTALNRSSVATPARRETTLGRGDGLRGRVVVGCGVHARHGGWAVAEQRLTLPDHWLGLPRQPREVIR